MNGRVRRNAQRLRPSDDAATPAPAAPPRGAWARATIGLIALALTVGACSVLAGVVAQVLGYRAAEFDVGIERGVAVVTSDGVRLKSDVFLPKGAARVPTILVRVPLDKTTTNTAFATTVGRLWAERGYAVVIQGTRGHYGSGGRAVPFLDERADGIEALRWIERQPWYDGRIGMWGGSYFGYTQWVVADQVEPGPAALFIQLCSTDLHRMFYPGGAFSLETALYWALRSRGDRDDPPSVAMLERAAAGFPLRAADDRAVEDVPAFNVWVDHPERDAYWAAVDGESRPERVRAPVLLMAGWYDPFLPTQLEDFVRIRAGAPRHVAEASRLIVGPWAHAETVTLPAHGTPRNYRLESLAPSLPWFDRHLRPSAPRAGNDQAVTLYVMGDNVWRDEAGWPPARARATPYSLRRRGRAHRDRRGAHRLHRQARRRPPRWLAVQRVGRHRAPSVRAAQRADGDPARALAHQHGVQARPSDPARGLQQQLPAIRSQPEHRAADRDRDRARGRAPGDSSRRRHPVAADPADRSPRRARGLAQEIEHAALGLDELDAQRIAGARERNLHLGSHGAGVRRQHDDAVGQVHRLRDVVGDVDDGLARLAPDVDQEALHLVARERIQGGERLVHPQHRRGGRERPCDRRALLHSARELVGIRAREGLEADQTQEAPRGLHAPGARHAFHPEAELDVALGRPPGGELGEVLEDDAAVEPLAGHRLAADSHLAARRAQESGEDVEQRRLAAAAPPHHADELGGAHAERDVLQRRHRASAGVVHVADLPELEVRDGRAHVRAVRTMPHRPTVRRSISWNTRRSKPRPSRPITNRVASMTSALRYSLESKMTQPSPQLVAAIISPPTTAIHERAKA